MTPACSARAFSLLYCAALIHTLIFLGEPLRPTVLGLPDCVLIIMSDNSTPNYTPVIMCRLAVRVGTTCDYLRLPTVPAVLALFRRGHCLLALNVQWQQLVRAWCFATVQ